MKHAPARQRFYELTRLTEEYLPLAECALCIAWEDQGECDVEAVLQHLDDLAGSARLRLEDLTQPRDVVAALNDYLFAELGFRGNYCDYNNPANSFIDRVLETRTGLPIILSIIYMEVGWRLGLPINGVALPGHFIARYHTVQEEILVDPFNQGRLWSWSDCERQVSSVYGTATPILMQQVMAPPSKHAILARLLRNLKHVYLVQQNFSRSLAAVERIVWLEPDNMLEIRDRGLLRVRLDQLFHGLEDLERYIRAAPHAPDLPELQQYTTLLTTGMVTNN